MARRRNNVVRYSRDYRRPPKWNMGLPPRRNRLADPRFYLRAVIGLATVGLVVLPGIADATLSILRPLAGGEESCRIYQVVDGDTVRMWCPGRGNVSARLKGFDTPELFSPQCASELAAAVKAKWALRLVLWQADEVRIVREGTDRYDRALVTVFIDGAPLARRMIADGHARAYGGGIRQTWCA
ncbi:thermonuclease family protein [Defluviimonas aestuarii]|uniref:thermonuclease family protein n=1 Tax=Albidovulum aestuarii TaxID=1130726 RepID=UPI00249ABCE9|nr:thermonuclease family protein [Defluviimonas aestuarii]MDI3335036.1 thermonuclease family protein [Defluviimonas aestuarii]